MPWLNLDYFAEKLHRSGEKVFFVQVGAMDGVTDDPIHDLVLKYGWRGILVEPIKDHFETLKRTYAGVEGLAFENAAIAERTGPGTMYRVPTQTVREKKLPQWALQASSFHLDRSDLGSAELKPHLVQETVACLTLPDLLAKHNVKELNVLQMDTEGYDFPLLGQLDFKKFKPQIINLEIVNMTKQELGQCKRLLDVQGYLYTKIGYDLLAVSLPV